MNSDEHPAPLALHPERGTSALLEYLWAEHCNIALLGFVTDVIVRADYVRFIAGKALKGETDYKEVMPTDLAGSAPGPATTRLRQSRQELLEMFLTRSVDNFEVYLVEVIRLALHKQPRILSERKQELSLADILQFDTIDSLTRDIIEGRLNSLSYEGFGEIERWCTSKAIPLVVPDGKREAVVEAIALRNIIVHNRGIIDSRYMKTVPSTNLMVGSKRLLEVDELFAMIAILDAVASISDRAIGGKFGLSEQPIREELEAPSEKRWPFEGKKVTPTDSTK